MMMMKAYHLTEMPEARLITSSSAKKMVIIILFLYLYSSNSKKSFLPIFDVDFNLFGDHFLFAKFALFVC